MKTVLIVTGDVKTFGSGHSMRMHAVALELKKRKITVQKITLPADSAVTVPLPYSVVVLDRRDTAFNPDILQTGAVKIAVDNRGPGRDEADIVCDLLPHHEMNKKEYSLALSHIILSPEITAHPCKAAAAKITLHNSAEEAMTAADFYPGAERLSPQEFVRRLAASSRPALYFGQALFEAVYLGLDVQLYPVSDYHQKLSVDLFSRILLESGLLTAVDGRGLGRFCDLVQQTLKKTAD